MWLGESTSQKRLVVVTDGKREFFTVLETLSHLDFGGVIVFTNSAVVIRCCATIVYIFDVNRSVKAHLRRAGRMRFIVEVSSILGIGLLDQPPRRLKNNETMDVVLTRAKRGTVLYANLTFIIDHTRLVRASVSALSRWIC